MTPADLVVTPMGLRFMSRLMPCTIGRGGIVAPEAKREGDNATPAGIHRIAGLLFRPDRMTAPAPWAEPIGPRDLWSDDPKDPAYNHLVQSPHPYSHESLRRADPLYDLILVTDWNWPDATSGQGSAIFMHRWRRPGFPTAGCVALSAQNLRWVASRAAPGTRLIVQP